MDHKRKRFFGPTESRVTPFGGCLRVDWWEHGGNEMKIPVMTPLTVVKGNDGKSVSQFYCYERIGGAVFKLPEGLTPDLEVPWTSEEKAGLPCFLKGDRSNIT